MRALNVTDTSDVPLTVTLSTGMSIVNVPLPDTKLDPGSRYPVNVQPPTVTVADKFKFAPPASLTA